MLGKTFTNLGRVAQFGRVRRKATILGTLDRSWLIVQHFLFFIYLYILNETCRSINNRRSNSMVVCLQRASLDSDLTMDAIG